MEFTSIVVVILWSQISFGLCVRGPFDFPYPKDADFSPTCNDVFYIESNINRDEFVSTFESIDKIYSEYGDSILWLLRARLLNGTLSEKAAVISLIEKQLIFPLLPDVIEVASQYPEGTRNRIAGEELEFYRRKALGRFAGYFGLWDQKYSRLYPTLDLDSWRALFHETMQLNPELFK